MNDAESKVRDEYRQLEEKRIYFLLAAAGTSIGFAVTQMGNGPQGTAIYLLLFSLFCFGISFASGLRVLWLEGELLHVNHKYLRLSRTTTGAKGSSETFENYVSREKISPLARKKVFWVRAQLVLLLLGGVSLPLWKLLECSACIKALAIPTLTGAP